MLPQINGQVDLTSDDHTPADPKIKRRKKAVITTRVQSAQTPPKGKHRQKPAQPMSGQKVPAQKKGGQKVPAQKKGGQKVSADKQAWDFPLFNPKLTTTSGELRRCQLTASTESQPRVHVFTLHEHSYGGLFEIHTKRAAEATREQKLSKSQALELREALRAER